MRFRSRHRCSLHQSPDQMCLWHLLTATFKSTERSTLMLVRHTLRNSSYWRSEPPRTLAGTRSIKLVLIDHSELNPPSHACSRGRQQALCFPMNEVWTQRPTRIACRCGCKYRITNQLSFNATSWRDFYPCSRPRGTAKTKRRLQSSSIILDTVIGVRKFSTSCSICIANYSQLQSSPRDDVSKGFWSKIPKKATSALPRPSSEKVWRSFSLSCA